ncbi:MAG: GNAT family N-acetyltransferase [Candidatus Eremiobacteraeota bacterium]|nr:GNAT family N-acetyltransferase [Candidatus Eremiobacteraeota bacterium]
MTKLNHRLINDVFRGPVYGQHDIFTAPSWARFVKQNDLDLSRALFVEDDRRVVGTIAFAQRGMRAWLSVMGVLPEYRRRGYGRRLFAGAVNAVRASGARAIEFEVVQRNEHARRMYESYGFRIVDELFVWSRKAKRVDDTLVYKRRTLASVRAIARDPVTCWQRDPIAVSRAAESALIEVEGAYAFVLKRNGNALLLDAGARDDVSARALLAQLDARVPYDITLLNEPSASPLTTPLEDAGWRVVNRQFRMMDAT